MSAKSKEKRPLLTLSMILKDEAATIEKTLVSVKPHIDRWVIADTGSTDDTKAVVTRALEGVPGKVVDIPFVDFATTRNAALDACGEETPFVIWLDADDTLEQGAALTKFLEQHATSGGPEHEAYYVRVQAGIHFDSARVLRTRAGWRFVGAVHEVLTCPGKPPPTHRVPSTLIRHDGGDVGFERSRKRWERDIGLLSGALEANPTDARSAFYLALTYRWLGRHEEAIQALERRVALGGWQEEVFQSKLEMAHSARDLGRPWASVMELYLDAHTTSPHRAEPLHAIALHYDRERNYALSLLFARRGFELPFPAQDRLFVDEDAYTWKLADLVGTAAYWVGEYELGEQAVRRALRHRPNDPRLQKNLSFYLERRKKKR